MAVRLRVSLMLLFGLAGGIVTFYFIYHVNSAKSQEEDGRVRHSFKRSPGRETVNLQNLDSKPTPQNSKCTYHSCVDVFRCGYNDRTRISVYVYPVVEYIDENGSQASPVLSREFNEVLEAISDSPYYTNNPETACLFAPSFDVLNQNNVRTKALGKLYSLLQW